MFALRILYNRPNLTHKYIFQAPNTTKLHQFCKINSEIQITQITFTMKWEIISKENTNPPLWRSCVDFGYLVEGLCLNAKCLLQFK